MRSFWKSRNKIGNENDAMPASPSDFPAVERERTTENPPNATEHEYIQLRQLFGQSNPSTTQASDESQSEGKTGEGIKPLRTQSSTYPKRTATRLNSDYGSIPSDRLPALERGLVRKLDLIILPLTMFLYLFSFLDKMTTNDLDQVGRSTGAVNGSEHDFYVAQALYYAGICIFAIPLTLLGKLFDPATWISIVTIVMGLAATLRALSNSVAAISVANFFSGMTQGTFSASVPLYYTYWYTREEMALRITMYVGIAASLGKNYHMNMKLISGSFSTYVAYAVSLIKSHLPPSKILYLITGIPTVVMGKIIFFLLPGRPEKTRYLTKFQRQIAVARAKKGLHPEPPSTIDAKAVKPAFLDLTLYIYALLYMCILLPNLSIIFFLPSVIREIGFVDMPGTALMRVPPLATSFIGMLLMAWKSDRMKMRGLWVSGICIVGGIGYVLLLTVRVAGVRYFAVFLVTWGTFPAIPLTLAWISGNCATETKRSLGLSIAVSLGNSIPISLPWTYPITAAPDFFLGYAICTGLLALACIIACGMHFYCRWENRVLDREYGRASGKDKVDGDEDVRFRYFH